MQHSSIDIEQLTTTVIKTLQQAMQPAAILLTFDNDGVLSSIPDNPLDAAPTQATVQALLRLAKVGIHIAIISGRRTTFLADRFGTSAQTGFYYRGLLGAETDYPTEYNMHPLGIELEPIIRDLAIKALDLEVDRVRLEDKGVTLCLHHEADDQSMSAARNFGAQSTLLHPKLLATQHIDANGGGNVEIRPDFGINKGMTMQELLKLHTQITHVVFMGDAPIDVPAANALRESAHLFESTLIVGVEHGLFEQQTMLDASDIILPDCAAVTYVLTNLADYFEGATIEG